MWFPPPNGGSGPHLKTLLTSKEHEGGSRLCRRADHFTTLSRCVRGEEDSATSRVVIALPPFSREKHKCWDRSQTPILASLPLHLVRLVKSFFCVAVIFGWGYWLRVTIVMVHSRLTPLYQPHMATHLRVCWPEQLSLRTNPLGRCSSQTFGLFHRGGNASWLGKGIAGKRFSSVACFYW